MFGLDGKALADIFLGMLPKHLREALPALVQFLPALKIEANLLYAFDAEHLNRVEAEGLTLGVKPTRENMDTIRRLVHLTKPEAIVVASSEATVTVIWAKMTGQDCIKVPNFKRRKKPQHTSMEKTPK